MRPPLFKAIAIATTLVLVAPTHPASASPEIQSTEAANSIAPEITPEVLGQAFEELSASDVPRNINDDSTVTFKLPGMDLTLRDPNAPTPYLSGGREDGGFWVEYTSVEQDLIISGGGFALGTAICAVPGVGWAACTVVGAILTGASVALSHNRKCPGSIRIHYSWAGAVRWTECR